VAEAGIAVPAPVTAPRLAVAFVAGLAAFMEVLDISIANVSLQHVAGSMAATQDEATWVLTSYLVTNAIALPISGWLATTIGRKRYFMGCILGFGLTSLLCGLAPSLSFLIVFRALQGITGGGLQPNSQAILADSFPIEKRGMAFAVYGLAVVFAPAIGPTLGGWITDEFSWRWVFLINVPVSVALLLLAQRIIEDPPHLVAMRRERLKRGVSIDYTGFGLLVLGMCALQVVLDRGQIEDWFASRFIATLAAVAAVSLAAFTVWELTREDPIVDIRLLGRVNFGFGNLLMLMLGFVLLSSTVLIPEFAQLLLGYTAEDAGLVMSPGGFAVMAMMPVVGTLVTRVDPRWLIAFGLTVNGLALLHMGQFDREVDYATIAWARVFQSIGFAFLFIPINQVAYLGMPREKSNAASAIINMTRNIGGSIGISVATTILARRTQVHQDILVQHVTPYSAPYRATVQALQQHFAAHTGAAVGALQQAEGAIYRTLQQQAQVLSFIDDFRFLALGTLLLVPLLLLIRRPTAGAAPPEAH
jgi:MFS transporter, DHA2 family, multidrug resistance protein